MAVKFPISVKSIECFHHEEHEEHKDFIGIFMSYLFLSKNFNLHRLQINTKDKDYGSNGIISGSGAKPKHHLLLRSMCDFTAY